MAKTKIDVSRRDFLKKSAALGVSAVMGSYLYRDASAASRDRITIYQKPIEALMGPDEERIKEQVRQTVIHEIAHYYGISDERLDELGY